ncbi:MAG: dihydropteroate synthase [Candidatus Firestonebacteria bacterium]
MFVIGERINGMFKAVKEAIINKDKKIIHEIALRQLEGGANALDVNVGPSTADAVGAMKWLVETIQEITDVTLVIDSPKVAVLEAGLSLCKKKAIINSTTAEKEKLDKILPLAQKYNAGIVGLTISEKGIPATASERVEIAANIIAQAMELGISPDDVYIDPVVLPVNVAQAQCPELLYALRDCKLICSPSPKTVVGLSNVSQGTKNRELINRTYLVMAQAYGLDAAIVDPTDKELMDAMITADLLLNKNIYCDSYLDAYRKSLSGK